MKRLSSYKNNGGVIVLGKGRKVLRRNEFNGNPDLVDVVVAEGIECIENDAFRACPNLRSVVLPRSLRKLKFCVFCRCVKLESVQIPDGVTEIGTGVFLGCASLKEIVLPNSLTAMGMFVFAKCAALRTVVLGTGLQRVPSAMFRECASLRSVVIPANVKLVNNRAFQACDSLTEAVLPKSLQRLTRQVFKDCKNLKRVVISYGALKPLEADDPAVVSRGASGNFVCDDICAGCVLQEVVVPDYLEVHLGQIFRDALPGDVKVVQADGTICPWQRETPKGLAFFEKYGVHAHEIRYSYSAAFDFYSAGRRIHISAKETRSVVVPARYKDGDGRELVAEIHACGVSRNYSILVGEEKLESYSLQRDAKKSKFWPVFAALAAYKPLRWN